MDVRHSRVHNYPPRCNDAPSQDLLVIRRNRHTGEVSLDPLRWGLIPYWCEDPNGGRKPINAKCQTVRTLPTFRDAYRRRRCIVPVDGFFEWNAIKGRYVSRTCPISQVLRAWLIPHRCRTATLTSPAVYRSPCPRRRSQVISKPTAFAPSLSCRAVCWVALGGRVLERGGMKVPETSQVPKLAPSETL
jgi:hypothetical protein